MPKLPRITGEELVKAIEKALTDKEFLSEVKRCENPYGDGKASQRIAEILSGVEITPQLLQKKISYLEEVKIYEDNKS